MNIAELELQLYKEYTGRMVLVKEYMVDKIDEFLSSLKKDSLRMNCKKLLSIGKTAEILGVHIDTLREWDKDGKLTPVKTPGNHRRYRLEDIEAFCGEISEKKDDEKAL